MTRRATIARALVVASPRASLHLESSMFLTVLPVFLFSIMTIRSTAMALSSAKTNGNGWSEVALKTASFMTKSQREKLEAAGALDVQRPVKIYAKRIDSSLPESESDANFKIIHFQRHGQGYHNLLGEFWHELERPIDMDSMNVEKNPFVRPEILDAPLTETGRQQCIQQKDVASRLNPQLVVVSPLQRAIQTALLSFAHCRDTVPWMAHEGCREEIGLLVCNKRRPLSDIRNDFPHINYSLMADEEDTLFHDDRRETLLEKSERAYDFLVEYIQNRPEKEIAVVGHSAWLFTMLNAVVDCGNDESLMSWFLTSEIRSMQVSFSDNAD